MNQCSTVTASDSLQTRRTLVSRLRNLDDQESWRVFFDRYWQLLYNVARQPGLSEEEARDIVQETVIGVARAMPEFRYNPRLRANEPISPLTRKCILKTRPRLPSQK